MGKGKVLKIYESRAVFEDQESNNSPYLLVTQSKDTGAREFEKCSKSQLPDLGNTSQVIPFESIYGFYDLLSGSYVALVVESEPYVSVNLMNIRKVKKMLVVPLFRNGRLLSEAKQKDEDRYLQLLHLGFAEHSLYFSYSSDITVTQQRLAKYTSKQSSEPLWSRADLRFFWNRDLIEDLVFAHADDWIVPFMSAYIEVRSDCPVDDVKVTLLFISRRSRYRQGCRFIKRGIDENGHVANFAETEQMLLFPDGKITSFVQIRGSIPVKWMSPVHMRYEPNVFIEEDKIKSTECAIKHMAEVIEKYADNTGLATVLMINLVDKKKDQGRLGEAYQHTIDAVRNQFPSQNIHLEWFDFHHETKQKGKWNNLSKLVMKVKDQFNELRFFCKLPNGQVTSWQRGVIRTNCMDNLDRTNVVQTIFARRSLVLQVGKSQSIEFNGSHIMQTPWKAFESNFKSMWTNNANAISMGYTGTGALKADFTKTGKRTFKGMFNDGVNSCMRYYINNFTDGVKQDAIDLMIGRYRPDPLGPSPFTQKSSQDAMASNFTKAFVLFIIIFISMIVLLPPMLVGSYGFSSTGTCDSASDKTCDIRNEGMGSALDRNVRHLQTHFLVSFVITSVILLYMMYKIMKKGSKVGEFMVLHPELCPEPLPTGRNK